MSDSCRTVVVAQNNVVKIEQCQSCEVFHVHLGALTLRIDPSVMRALQQSVNEAMQAEESQPFFTTPHAPSMLC